MNAPAPAALRALADAAATQLRAAISNAAAAASALEAYADALTPDAAGPAAADAENPPAASQADSPAGPAASTTQDWPDDAPVTEAEPSVLDPDCRDGKHGSCVGGPCECDCHDGPEDLPHRVPSPAPKGEPTCDAPDGNWVCEASPTHAGDHAAFHPDGTVARTWPQEEAAA